MTQELVRESMEVIVQETQVEEPLAVQTDDDSSLVRRLVFKLILLTIFFLPLVFAPLTSEYYETTKQAFLVVVLPLMLVGLVSIVLRRRVFVTTPLDKIVVCLLGATVLSAVFSINRQTSIIGHYGRFHGSLANLLLYIGLFWVVTNTISSFSQIKTIVISIASSSSLLAILGIFQRLGVYVLPLGFARVRSWTPLGSPTALGFLTAMTLPLTLAASATIGTFGWLFFLAFLAQLFLLGLTANWLAWFVALVGLVAFRPQIDRGKLISLLIFGSFALGLSWGPLRTRLLPAMLTGPAVEVVLPPKISAQVVWQAVNNRPFLGNGPETYILNYPRYKPEIMNRTLFWNFRFDRPYNEILYLLATVGLVGTALYLWLWIKAGRTGLATGRQLRDYPASDRLLASSLTAALVAYLIHLLFYYTTTTTVVYFWVILALLAVINGPGLKDLSRIANYRYQFWLRLMPLASLAAVALIYFFYFGRYYRAQLHYGAALRAFAGNQRQPAREHLLRAVSLNSRVDVFQTGLSTVDLALAQNLSQGGEPNRQQVTALVQEGINAAQKARQLNPMNVQNWEHLAGFYRLLVNLAQGADSWVLVGFANAIELDPLNPRLRENLGSFYTQQGKVKEAENSYQVALRIKPDFVLARYNLSRLYRAEEKYDEAKRELRQVLALLPAGVAARSSIEAQIEDLDKLASGEAEKIAKQIEAQTAKEELPSIPLDVEPPIATPSGERQTFFPPPPPLEQDRQGRAFP